MYSMFQEVFIIVLLSYLSSYIIGNIEQLYSIQYYNATVFCYLNKEDLAITNMFSCIFEWMKTTGEDNIETDDRSFGELTFE